jgi:UDP-perosamine 4-acetyltransferase
MRRASKRAIVVGGGGHARVLVDAVEDMQEIELVGFVSANKGELLYGYPCLGSDEVLPMIYESGISHALLAIGDNRGRKSAMAALKRHGFTLINVISRGAQVSKYAQIGTGVAILPGGIVNANAKLSDAVIVNTNASVDHDCILGECVHVGPGASVAGGVRLDDGVFLGAGSSIVPRVSIGAWTVVGAGAVVISDLPANVVAVGVPAAPRTMNRTGE